MRYEVDLLWTWGKSQRFDEHYVFTVSDRSEIDERVREFIGGRQFARLAFDCSRLDYPLHPTVCSLTITPVTEREYQHDLSRFDDACEEAITAARTNIEESRRA